MGFSYGRLISNEIGNTNSSSRFCNFCSEHGGGYCDVAAEVPFEERKRLVSFRNSLKEVENMVLFLERLDSRKMMDMNAAFNSLEESRLNLLANVTEYKGRALDVLTELNACFGHENGEPFDWDLRERMKKHVESSGAHHSRRSLITNFMRKLLLIPWKWQQKVGIAVKLALSAMATYHIKKLICSSSRKMIPFVVSRGAGKSITSVLTISKSPLDVLCARG
ncbi:uncharacterized protein LOC126803654 [Argentina anserina]|uniref:uncharacterized protein LOC126803654 n=1 Tax=Argentina anserina TaxID=57926 RepID=UPI002176911D|nr:uncharacterized protein LOC126803654 [Potentilla anserina]